MNFTTLVTVPELAAHLDDAGWIVCDCRHDLAQYDAGSSAYAKAHIPGARFLHLDEDLSGPKTGVNGRHPLPHPITFTLRLAALGIDNRRQVVAYDNSGGVFAARLWWMLRWVGHTRVAVLDGGMDSWVKAGHPVTAQWPSINPATYNPDPHPQLAVDTQAVFANLRDNALRIVDARSPDRFRGENETLDPVAGHIAGAINRFFKHNLREDGCFKSAADLRHEFTALLNGQSPNGVVHQCGSGVTACHNLLAMETAGMNGSRLYPGSWSEWVSDRARPVATGNA
jgi:thiosulfate/3-mercaptopyruvate sulfurtransferase